MINFLSESSDITTALGKLSPIRIAVAYVGINWRDFISVGNLEEIIVSPNLGTHPVAISEIEKEIGWEKVHFLDNLHSKIYIGDDSVIIGSANLSKNAMGTSGLYELCILTDEKHIIEASKKLFEFYKKEAQSKYDETQKRNRLEKLRAMHNDAIANRIIPPDKNRTFSEYSPGVNGDFYIIWYREAPVKYNTKKIAKSLPKIPNEEFDFGEFERQSISPRDDIKIKKWILCWKITQQNTVNRSTNIYWMYIDIICNDCCKDEGYENVAIEFLDTQKRLNPPFTIDNDFQKAFIKTIERKKYDTFRDTQGDIWLARNTEKLFRPFINDIKKLIA